MNYNKVIVVGRLCANPELKNLPGGALVCSFRIATNRTWKDAKTNEKREDACFIDVDAFDKRAKFVNDWFLKGNQILVEGRLRYRTWETKEGEARSKHSIVAEQVTFVDPVARHADTDASDTDDAAPGEDAAASSPTETVPASPVAARRRERALAAVGAIAGNEKDIPF
jgi:single-strand DNA-binding protein